MVRRTGRKRGKQRKRRRRRCVYTYINDTQLHMYSRYLSTGHSNVIHNHYFKNMIILYSLLV